MAIQLYTPVDEFRVKCRIHAVRAAVDEKVHVFTTVIL